MAGTVLVVVMVVVIFAVGFFGCRWRVGCLTASADGVPRSEAPPPTEPCSDGLCGLDVMPESGDSLGGNDAGTADAQVWAATADGCTFRGRPRFRFTTTLGTTTTAAAPSGASGSVRCGRGTVLLITILLFKGAARNGAVLAVVAAAAGSGVLRALGPLCMRCVFSQKSCSRELRYCETTAWRPTRELLSVASSEKLSTRWMAALTSAGSSMSLDEAPSVPPTRCSGTGRRIFGGRPTLVVVMVSLVSDVPILLVVVVVVIFVPATAVDCLFDVDEVAAAAAELFDLLCTRPGFGVDSALSESELLPLVLVDVVVAVVDVEAVRLVVFFVAPDPLGWLASLRFALMADAFFTSRCCLAGGDFKRDAPPALAEARWLVGVGDDESDVSESESEQAEQHDELDRSAVFFIGDTVLEDDLIGSLWWVGRAPGWRVSLLVAADGTTAELAERANFMRRPPVSDLKGYKPVSNAITTQLYCPLTV